MWLCDLNPGSLWFPRTQVGPLPGSPSSRLPLSPAPLPPLPLSPGLGDPAGPQEEGGDVAEGQGAPLQAGLTEVHVERVLHVQSTVGKRLLDLQASPEQRTTITDQRWM